MLFSAVIGQEQVKQHLIDMVAQDRVPHAQLFLSQPGAGGLPLAMAFAQYLVCEQRTETDSCGVCPACNKAQKLIHPDIHFAFPVINKNPSHKPPQTSVDYLTNFREAFLQQPYINEFEWLQFIDAENKQGNIPAEEARIIIRTLSLTTFESNYKIQLIWMAEALGKEGNILLKLLEEPPANTVLILIAENQEEILPTILSRCQLVKINKIHDEAVAEALLRYGVPQSATRHIAYLADGDFHEAIRLAQSESQVETRQLTDLLRFTIRMQEGSNVGLLLKWVEEMSKTGRENLKAFLEYFLHICRETLQVQFVQGAKGRLSEEEKKVVSALIKYSSVEKIGKVLSLINAKHYEIERNVSAKLVLMDLSLKLQEILLSKK